LLAAVQAVPEAEPPQCDLKHPENTPCVELERIVYLPATMLRLPALGELGGESIRVTMTPSWGGRGELYQVTRDPQGRANLLAVWVYGHPYVGWEEIGREEVVLTEREYRRLAARVDQALARPDPEVDMICLDGPVWRTERHRDRQTAYFTAAGCGGQGSDIAFSQVATFACRQVGRDASLAPVRSSCRSRLRLAREDR
jgi:hypothetical protein